MATIEESRSEVLTLYRKDITDIMAKIEHEVETYKHPDYSYIESLIESLVLHVECQESIKHSSREIEYSGKILRNTFFAALEVAGRRDQSNE